jgi:type IV pilus assembly protein PilC
MRLRDLMRRRAFRAFKGGYNSFSDEIEMSIRPGGYRWLLEGNTLIDDLKAMAAMKLNAEASNVLQENEHRAESPEDGLKRNKFAEFTELGIEKKAQILRQISLLLSSGTDLRIALAIIIGQESKTRAIRNILQYFYLEIESGGSLSRAMMASRTGFDAAEIAMLRAGESIGELAETMERMANLLDKRIRVKKKIFTAMGYPLTVMVVALAVVFMLTGFVIPRFEKILEEQIGNRAMPTLTSIIIGSSRWIFSHWPEIFVALILGFVSIYFIKCLGSVREIFYKFLTKMPFIGSSLIQWNVLIFTRTFGDLLLCGLAVIEALKLSSASVGNFMMKDRLNLVILDVQQGMSLADSIRRRKIFSTVIEGLIKIGEESGQLGKMMNQIAINCEAELDEIIARISSILEPMMVVILAIFVGTIIIGLFMPLVSLIQGIMP